MVDPQVQQDQTQEPTGLVPGAGVKANPAGILAGAPDLATAVASAFMQHLAQNQPPPTQAVQQQRAQAAAAAAPVTTPNPASSDDAGNGRGMVGDLDAGLGDAAHASDTKGGWLTGITNTLNARNQRLAQESKDAQLHAKNQAEIVAMHRNMYLQDTGIRQASYGMNQNYVDTMAVNHDIQTDVSQEQLAQRMKDKNFVKEYSARATSEIPVLDSEGKQVMDKQGNPVTKPSFTIVKLATKDGQPDNLRVTADLSSDAKRLLGATLPKDTKLTEPQFTALTTQVAAARTATNILDSTNGKPLSEDQMKSLQPYMSDPTILGAISHVPGSAYAGLMQWQQNADDHLADLNNKMEQAKANKDQGALDKASAEYKSIQQEKAKIAQFAAQAISPAQVAAYDKKAEENITLAKKALTDPGVLTGDKASGVLAQLQENLAAATDPKQRVEITRAISAAKVARDNYFEDQKRKANADQFAKQGDPDAAARSLVNHDLTLADLRTRQTTSEFIEQVVNKAKILDKNYNPADEIAFEKVAASPRNETLFGSSRSIIEAGGTADQIVALGQQLPDTGWPRLNSYADWLEAEKDHGAFSGYASMSLGLADDYGKVMGGGAASDRARDHALSLLAAAHTQDARVAAVREIVNATMSQRKGTIGNNSFTERQYNNFDKSPLATAWTQQNAADVAAANAHQKAQQNGGQQQPKTIGAQLPDDLKGKGGISVQTFKRKDGTPAGDFWTDAQGKPIRAVKAGELPQ